MSNAPFPENAASASRRRTLQRLLALTALQSGTLPLFAACGGSSSDPIVAGVPPPPVPTPPPSVPVPPPPPVIDALSRLKAALASVPPTSGTVAVTITQGQSQSIASTFGDSAQFFPPLPQTGTSNLATIPQVYGYRRDLWTQQQGDLIAGQTVVAVRRDHIASSNSSSSRTCLHFVHTGAAFEVLVAGVNLAATLIVDGRYVGTSALTPVNDLPGGLQAFAAPNATLKFDFGLSAQRRISLYLSSSQGPCALVVAAGDTLSAYDRSAEASFAAMTDSYGGASSDVWGVGGLFYEAAAQLGIPHADLDAIGSTGYAPNSSQTFSLDAGNDFVARLGSIVDGLPDLFVTAGSINDNNHLALPPYATASAATLGFANAVSVYYTNLRSALPNAVLAAIGPWEPPPNLPASPTELAKASVIKSALQAAGGRWVYVDNVNGGWVNSAGAGAAPSANDGPWQTLRTAVGDIDEDNVHPSRAGCLQLATRLATSLRAGILAL
jgi:lysophospholipase L1-like esterase